MNISIQLKNKRHIGRTYTFNFRWFLVWGKMAHIIQIQFCLLFNNLNSCEYMMILLTNLLKAFIIMHIDAEFTTKLTITHSG